MSRKIPGGPFLIEVEPERRCELCGKIEETRPYGPNGERVCFQCGMENEEAALKQYNKALDGK
jgi:hypothetical protein